MDLLEFIKSKGATQAKLAKLSVVSITTLKEAVKGKKINLKTANSLVNALDLTLEEVFSIKISDKKLSPKTVLEHHGLISSVLSQAEKEMLVPFNVSSKIILPKITRTEVNYFQPEEIEKIRDCLEQEPLKWKLITHLLFITGCRRGEIAGLKWSKIDFENCEIKINTSLLYSKERGIYEDTTKTGNERIVSVPKETINLIKFHKKENLGLKLKNGSR